MLDDAAYISQLFSIFFSIEPIISDLGGWFMNKFIRFKNSKTIKLLTLFKKN